MILVGGYQAKHFLRLTKKYVEEYVKCNTCKGSKAKPGTSPINCNSCNGTGFKTVKQGMMVMQTLCEGCQGQGTKIKDLCPSCKGNGTQQSKAYETITIPKGI